MRINLADARLRNYLAVALLTLLAALSMAKHWGGPISWETDSLFYQATTQEIEGQDAKAARHEVFTGPLSSYERQIETENPQEPARISDPAWVEYSAPFYARRLLLPGLAALISPILGLHALLDLSLFGFVLIPGLIFAFLRQRFSLNVSFMVALATILWPPLRAWSVFPLSDTTGVVLLIAALLCAAFTFEKDRRWLAPWFACVLALGFTRDLAFMPVVSAICLLIVRRDRLSLALAGTGFVAAIPPLLVEGISQTDSLAYVYANHTIPTDTGLGAVIAGYPGNLAHMIGRYGDYAASHPLTVLIFLVGVAAAFAFDPRSRDPFTVLIRSTLLGYLLLLAIGPAYSAFRYELVLIPLVAFGYGSLATVALRRLRDSRSTPRARNDVRPSLARR